MRLSRWLFLAVLLLGGLNLFLVVSHEKVELPPSNYFIAANYMNSEKTLPHALHQITRLISLISQGNNVYVSIFENGSTDSTPELLQDFGKSLSLPHTITTCELSGSDKWANVPFKKERFRRTRSFADKRYRAMAALRNKALEPLASHKFPNEDWPTKVVFLNDIFFYAEDIVGLLNTNGGQFDLACGLDFYYLFYDVLATRDIDGNWLSGYYPFASHAESKAAVHANQPFRVYSCWNGVAAFDAKPLTSDGVKFRARLYDNSTCECVQSECLLIATDFRKLGLDRIFVNPAVRVTYDWRYYPLHNWPGLSHLYYWVLSFSYDQTELGQGFSEGVGCGMPPYWQADKPTFYMKEECTAPFDTERLHRQWTPDEYRLEVRAAAHWADVLNDAC
jgi:hypothetical protein